MHRASLDSLPAKETILEGPRNEARGVSRRIPIQHPVQSPQNRQALPHAIPPCFRFIPFYPSVSVASIAIWHLSMLWFPQKTSQRLTSELSCIQLKSGKPQSAKERMVTSVSHHIPKSSNSPSWLMITGA